MYYEIVFFLFPIVKSLVLDFQVTAREHLKHQLAERRRKMDEMSSEVDRSAKLICKESASLHKVDVLHDAPLIMNPTNFDQMKI
jgi:hypothetical protein